MTQTREPALALTLTDAPEEAAQAVIAKGLRDHALAKIGYRDARPLAILARKLVEGKEVAVGGLLGRTSFGLFYIDRFFLPEGLRGQGLGGRIIALAEKEAARRGCSRAVLFTADFQAPQFYLDHGYEVLGRLDCEPPGHTRFCMTKKLDGARCGRPFAVGE